MFSTSKDPLFRQTNNPKETIDFIFEIAKKFISDGTDSGLITGFRLLEFLVSNTEDKKIRGFYGRVQSQLEQRGLLEDILKDVMNQKNDAGNIERKSKL